MHRIALEFPNKNYRFKKMLKYLTPALNLSVPGTPLTLNFESLSKAVDNVHSIDKPVPAITEELQRMIGHDRRLIVFVDELDRCTMDNSLKILESIKLFLQAKNIIFIIAVDMRMLERAWELRYGLSSQKAFKAKDHIDKIFQLQLNIPFKGPSDIMKFIETHAPYLCPDEFKILVSSLKQNPRKIKNILNALNFTIKGMTDQDESRFNDLFPAAFIWSIISTSYPDLIDILGTSIDSDIIKLALISYFFENHHNLQMKIKEFDDVLEKDKIVLTSDYYIPGKIVYSSKRNTNLKDVVLGRRILDGLSYLEKDPSVFYFFAVLGNVILLNPFKLQRRFEGRNKYDIVECPEFNKVKELENKDLTRLLSANYQLADNLSAIIHYSY